MSTFFEQKVKTPVVKLLKSGASPSSIALAMAFGVSGGIFPIPGVTTVPVMAAIFLFRLNPVAAMLTNYLVTPLNIASVPVFMFVHCRCYVCLDNI
ncbi:Membrane protein [Phytophthora megakarya]|uniref:Membrane protein n=1 Tax=Phytophthora megakarya TaxID=4795 RepID=A0A225W2G0_9STRA|nr:Membrane protein [Phytophthora megakarya]